MSRVDTRPRRSRRRRRSATIDGSPAPSLDRRRLRWITVVGPLVTLALFLAFWEYMHRDGMRRFFDKPGFLLPSPVTVIDQSFLDAAVREQMIRGLGWTTVAAVVGLAISIVVGIALAVAMAQAQWIERSMYPYLVALQAIPVLAIVPLIGSVFGGGLGARIYVCVMISIFPIVTNTLFGLTSADPAQHDLFTLRHASRRTRLRKLQFPAAMPAIFTGFRISAGLSVIGAVVGEQFFRAGREARHRRAHGAVPAEGTLPAGLRRADGRRRPRHRRVLPLRAAQQARRRPVVRGDPQLLLIPA